MTNLRTHFMTAMVFLSGCLLLTALCPRLHAAPAASSNELTLVKDGKPTSVILVSCESNASAWFAAGELVDHIHKITGAAIPIVTDNTAGEVPPGVRILVGDSRWAHDAELSSKEFQEQEYLIRFTPDTLILMGRDEGGGAKSPTGAINTNLVPDGFQLQGTSYAVHDFLERYCDVRWYAPTPLGVVYPSETTLVVKGAEVRRKPRLEFRGGLSAPSVWGMTGPATNNQMALHAARLRAGGKQYAVSHSFEAYPDRFLKKNPGNPSIWEGEHPEYFAKDADGYPQPYQMCYSSTALVAQVVKDAQAVFAGKTVPGVVVGENYFCVVPRDTDLMCHCKKCLALLGKPDGHFSDGEASKLVWKFTIAVANQFTNKLPGKYVGQLAYRNYAFYPTGLKIPTNVMIGPCIWDGERLWSEEASKYEYNNYKTWVSKTPGQLTSMWFYQCFPGETAGSGGFHYFMPFYAHVLDRQMKLFAKDGLRGMFLCGTAEYVDGYLTYKLMDDPSLDVDDVLSDFFARYYGPASNAMADVYRKIETTYTDLERYPNKHPATSEAVEWKCLGNNKVMGELEFSMKKAGAAVAECPATNAYALRVKQFDKDFMEYMTIGHDRYEMKVKYKAQADAARKRKPPKAQASLLPATAPKPAGDPAKIDWKKVPVVEIKNANDGYPADRPASFQAVHDGTTIYMRLSETTDTSKIEPGGLWWAGDHWAVFLARGDTGPYKYFRVPLQGAAEALAVDPDAKPVTSVSWADKLKVTQHVTSNEWAVLVSCPMTALDDGHPVKPGSRLRFNVVRNSFGGESHLAWAPTFEGGYYSRTRAGFLTLLPH